MNCYGSSRATPISDIFGITAVTIWDEWADANGDLGPVYGHQWRSWPAPDGRSIDQIADVVGDDQAQPGFAAFDRQRLESRRSRQDGAAALPTVCSSSMSQTANCRASSISVPADVFLGVPFNIASYALLTMMVAQVTDLKPGDFVHSLGDAHLYSKPSRPGPAAIDAADASAAGDEDQSRGEGYLRLPL